MPACCAVLTPLVWAGPPYCVLPSSPHPAHILPTSCPHPCWSRRFVRGLTSQRHPPRATPISPSITPRHPSESNRPPSGSRLPPSTMSRMPPAALVRLQSRREMFVVAVCVVAVLPLAVFARPRPRQAPTVITPLDHVSARKQTMTFPHPHPLSTTL